MKGISPQLVLGLVICDRVYTEYGQELVITSLNDGHHMEGSLHYKGDAADLRTRYFSGAAKDKVSETLRERLGIDFDVILETDHIHIEYDPK